MLARVGLLAMAMCLCLCLSQVGVLSNWMNGLIWLFGMKAFFNQSYTVLQGISGIYKNKGTSLWNFFLNSGLRKFRHGISIVERAINLAGRTLRA